MVARFNYTERQDNMGKHHTLVDMQSNCAVELTIFGRNEANVSIFIHHEQERETQGCIKDCPHIQGNCVADGVTLSDDEKQRAIINPISYVFDVMVNYLGF